MKFKILFLTIFFSIQVLAQTSVDIDQQVKDMIARQRKLVDTMMKDQQDFDKHIKKLFERLQKQGAFKSFNQRIFDFSNSAVKTAWHETKNEKKLVIDLDAKNDKVSIKIDSGVVNIKGKRKVMSKFGHDKSSYGERIINIEQTMTIPNDVVVSSAKFTNEKGKVVIVFSKKPLVKKPVTKLKTKAKSI